MKKVLVTIGYTKFTIDFGAMQLLSTIGVVETVHDSSFRESWIKHDKTAEIQFSFIDSDSIKPADFDPSASAAPATPISVTPPPWATPTKIATMIGSAEPVEGTLPETRSFVDKWRYV